jgi:hypothetical protein
LLPYRSPSGGVRAVVTTTPNPRASAPAAAEWLESTGGLAAPPPRSSEGPVATAPSREVAQVPARIEHATRSAEVHAQLREARAPTAETGVTAAVRGARRPDRELSEARDQVMPPNVLTDTFLMTDAFLSRITRSTTPRHPEHRTPRCSRPQPGQPGGRAHASPHGRQPADPRTAALRSQSSATVARFTRDPSAHIQETT